MPSAILFPEGFTHTAEVDMNWERIEGQWEQLKGKVRAKWGKLTDDDLRMIAGKKDTLVGKLRERYGQNKEAAERDIDSWIHSLDKSSPKH
jgi:uncharacterized protein YjbJ (UPF0337 family)